MFIHQIWWRRFFFFLFCFFLRVLGYSQHLKHLHFTLTGRGGQWTGELKCYFGQINGKLMSLMHSPQPHTLSVGTAVHQEFTAYVAFFFFPFLF